MSIQDVLANKIVLLCIAITSLLFASTFLIISVRDHTVLTSTVPSSPPITAPIHTRDNPSFESTSSAELGLLAASSSENVLPNAPSPTSTTFATTTQYVVIAFDGSRSFEMWKQTRDFAKMMEARNAPIHFTYFINTVYLLASQHRMMYLPPQHATGTSPIGFAATEREVADRLERMNGALNEGHEIGCHMTGHYSGATWSQKEWEQEFQSFFDIVNNVSTINHLEKEPPNRSKLLLPPEGIIGFRAPELGVNTNLWPALQKYGLRYDTSLTGKPGTWPAKLPSGLWEFPLQKIPFAGSTTSSVLSMDYNFYFKQSKAIDNAKRDTPLWSEYYTQALTSYRDYFEKSYKGNRAPIYIGHHFSLWNDGVYWDALKQFAYETCGRPEVKCVTFKEAMQAMSTEK